MRAVDTNVLVRLLTRDDRAQAAAADRWVVQGAWVPMVALVEAVWVLDSVYERTPDQITLAVEMLLEHRELTLQDPEIVRAALEVFRSRPRLGFSDCVVLETARKSGNVPLGTFDRDLGKVSGAEALR